MLNTQPLTFTADASQPAVLGGGALGVQGQYLLGDLLYVGDAKEGDLDLGNRVVCACCARGENCDVAGAVGALAVLDADDVGGGVGLYRAVGRASDDHHALVGDGVDSAAAFEKGPQGRKNDTQADQQKWQAKQREDGEALRKRIGGGFV